MYTKTKPITSWAEDDRPREKLIAKGQHSLSNAELIAILIATGTRKLSAVDLAKVILDTSNNNLIDLSKLSVKDLMKFDGIGQAKAITIIAALELGRRRRESEAIQKEKITSSKDVFEVAQSSLADLNYESFLLLLLNRANKVLKKIQISEGGVSGTVADPKKIFKIALENNASSIILAHNHPSGNVKPSHSDIHLTEKIKNGAEHLDISLLDHIIVGDESYYSFADEGIL